MKRMKSLLLLALLAMIIICCDGLKRDRKQDILDPADSDPTATPNPILTLMKMQKDKNDNVVKVTPTPKPDPYEDSHLPRGRIQVLTSNREPTCLARAASGTKNLFYFILKPCEYEDDQFFVYRRQSQRLMMADRLPSPAYRLVATQIYNSKIPGYEGKFPLVLEDDESGNFYPYWSVSWTDFGLFTITTDNDDSQVCLQISDGGVDSIVFGRYMANPKDTSACAAFKFMLPEDDFVAGSIRVFNNTAANAITNQCVTYREAESPDSSLYVAPCDSTDANQRFVYNMLTFHLRTANGVAKPDPVPYDGPGLFFWWKGRIKAYPDLDEVANDGYGWLLPLRRSGAVYAWDNRGFSGKCWRLVSDGSIQAEQVCHNFGFYPEKDNFFTRRRGLRAERNYKSVFVFVNGTTNCLTMSRVPLVPDDSSKGWLLRPYVDACKLDPMAMHQRWVLTQAVDAPCNSKSCRGLLRWSGDVFNSLVVPQLWSDYDFTSDRYLTITADREQSVPFEFDFPFDRPTQGQIRNVATSAPYSNPVCWTMSKQNFVVLGTTNCLKFNLVPPNRYGPNPTQGETVIARFDSKSLMVMPGDTSRSNVSSFNLLYGQASKSNFVDEDVRAQFERFFDMFYADLGDFGHRRFRLHSGSRFQVRATGELLVRGGMVFPVLPSPEVTSSSYTLFEMSVRFFRIELKRSGSFLLMSNARASGCIVYATFAGRIGLKCYNNYQVVAQSHITGWGPRTSEAFSMVNGAVHRVSLLLSTQSGGQVILFLDSVPLFTLPYVWSPTDSSPNLYLFTDPNFWQYRYPYINHTPRSAGMWMHHVSIYTCNNANRLREIVNTRWNHDMARFDNSVPASTAPANLKTTWSNCKFYRNTKTNLLYALRCTVTPSVQVPVDTLSLSCSRPTCTMQFILPKEVAIPGDLPTASSYDFVYKPNFPATFTSEDAGAKRTVTDPSFISDGFLTKLVSFDLGFVQDNSFSKLQTDARMMDLFSYQCLQIRNPFIADLFAEIIDTFGDIFW